MWALKLLLIPAGLYLLAIAFLFFAQTSLVFPARHVGPAGALPPEAQRLELPVRAGLRLHGIHIPATAPATGQERTLVLGFGGNAADAAATAAMLHDLYPEADAAAFYYRGYRPSGGRPGAAALKEDATVILDEMRRQLRPGRVVAVGFSVGSGVASALAAQRPLEGLILVTPFDSLAETAAGHYRWAPVRLLFRHPLEPARDLAGLDTPVAIVAAERDTLIVPARTEALRRSVPNLVFDRTISGVGHNDIYDHPGFRQAMGEALQAVLGATPRLE
jgi:pimeloyl-ACP methyl ester carboxylesterase